MGVAPLDVRRRVRNLVKKYQSSDPFYLMGCFDIIHIKYPLSRNIRGFYFTKLRRKIVVINEIYDERRQVVTAAHELGHCLFHPATNALFLERKTLLLPSRYEKEANKFAVELLTIDKDMTEYEDCTIEQVACALDIPEELMKMKL